MMNKKPALIILIAFTAFFSLFTNCTDRNISDQLKEGFINPPDSARPGVYWYFMDGNLDREAMTEDLESMKDAGIGYVLFLEVNVGVPRGKIDFLSEEWQELFKHAVKECERLGIRLIMGSGPGWAGSGGPWVKPEQSMSHLVASDTTLTGPAHFKSVLPVPAPRTPFFGEGALTPALKKIRDEWYEDVIVLAFPEPDGNLKIDRSDEKALYYRAPFTSQPGVLPYIPEYKEGNTTDYSSVIEKGRIIDLTANMHSDGSLDWNVPEGRWTIMRFGKRNNGAVTRPAPDPGIGFEADKFDTVSFDAHYYEYIGKLLKKVQPEKTETGGGWTMIHIDSWEMGAQNWSPEFRKEFTARRGYDPVQFLPVFSGLIVESPEISERFLWDIRQTSNELILENHAGRFKELGKRSGFRLSVEPYDMNPASDLDLGSVADVPMCEFWSDGYGFNSAFSCIEATSIAHITGAPVVAAEAFTADHTEAWKQHPGSMKNQGDWAFCMGINRLVYHTFAHKPLPDQYRPGMTMGPYGVHWDRGQTWWPMAKAYHEYIARCQYVLSQGKAVSDILYLTPEGAPHVFIPPATSLEGTSVLPDKKGYSFDGCSPMQLIKNASVKDGKIVFQGGGSYEIMVLPNVESMTPELTEKIGMLVNEGAVVVGNPPKRSPSLTDFPQCDETVRDLAGKTWGSLNIPSSLTLHESGKGRIWWGKSLLDRENLMMADSLTLYPDYKTITDLLEDSGLSPDFKSSGNIRYIHRSFSDKDVYFLSNRTSTQIKDSCIFRNGSQNAEIWFPVNGEIKNIESFNMNNHSGINIDLQPYESCFIVFYHDGLSNTKEKYVPAEGIGSLLTLDGPWNVTFDTIFGGPEKVIFDSLYDWSKSKDERIRYFSGVATYSMEFDLPEGFQRKGNIYLDLGNLKNLGRISINGRELGVLWTAPWRVEITECLKNSGNILKVEVANLWVNRLIGDENYQWDGVEDGKWPGWLIDGSKRPSKRYTFTTHRYYKKGDELIESGLIGPVTIKVIGNPGQN